MSGVLGDYRKLVADAQKKRISITSAQRKQIAGLYAEAAAELADALQKYDKATLTHRWLKDYSKSLQTASKALFSNVKGIVADSMKNTAQATVDAEMMYYTKLAPRLSEKFRDVFSAIPQKAVDELMSGGLYDDFAGLSVRIWNYRKQFNRDIQTVINKGILAKKSAYDLAKDLELYLNPKAAKPWDWSQVYPGVNKQVDYCSQRLARTAVTHAYQLSFQRSTVDNPFVENYRWHSSNGGRTCDLCRARNGKLFPKNRLPLDHPNGMCVVTAEITKSYNQIADELARWANGEENQGIDKWLGRDIIQIKDTVIGRSLGAKSRNYDIVDPETGDFFHFVEGTKIQNSEVFAGKGTRSQLHDGVAEGLTKEFGGKPNNWQHCKGHCILDYFGEERPAEVHWFQEGTVGKVKFKVKGWDDES